MCTHFLVPFRLWIDGWQFEQEGNLSLFFQKTSEKGLEATKTLLDSDYSLCGCGLVDGENCLVVESFYPYSN